MKKVAIVIWNIITVLMILILLLGIVYFKFLSNKTALIVFGLTILGIYIVPMLFNKQRRRKILLIENLFINALILILFSILLIKSPGTPKQFTNQTIDNSISEWDKVEIGGIDQWLLIKGENKDNPIILYLTGGFGLSTFHLIPEYYPQLEQDFTTVYWEQRGSGKSFSEQIANETINFDQLTSDINEIAEYLKKKLNKEKIIILGHSWGTSIGLLAANRYPENFHFYLGIAQVVNPMVNTNIRYQLILNQAIENNNLIAVEEIKKLGEPPYQMDELWRKNYILTNWADYFSVTEFSKNWMKAYHTSLLTCPEYTLIEKIKFKSQNKLYLVIDDFVELDFHDTLTNFSIPIYFVQGANDYISTTQMVKQYYDTVKAPHKDILILEDCAHDPQFDYPDKFHDFLITKIADIENDN
jgi:pimeloyl-ACP methyl ester carboxylesterase